MLLGLMGGVERQGLSVVGGELIERPLRGVPREID